MKDGDFSYENLKKMTYIDYVEKEVTRFYGPINNGFGRIALKDYQIKGVPIKCNTIIKPQSIGVHYD